MNRSLVGSQEPYQTGLTTAPTPLSHADKREMLVAKKPNPLQRTQRILFIEELKEHWGVKSKAVADSLGVSVDYLYKLSKGIGGFSENHASMLLKLERSGFGMQLDLNSLGLFTWDDIHRDMFGNPELDLVVVISTTDMPITASALMRKDVIAALGSPALRIAYVFPLESLGELSYAEWMGHLEKLVPDGICGYVAGFYVPQGKLEHRTVMRAGDVITEKRVIPPFDIASNIMFLRFASNGGKSYSAFMCIAIDDRATKDLTKLLQKEQPRALWSRLREYSLDEVRSFVDRLIASHPWLDLPREKLPVDVARRNKFIVEPLSYPSGRNSRPS